MKGIMRKLPKFRKVGFTVAEIARYLRCPFQGDGNVLILGVDSIEEASEGDLVYCSGKKFRSFLKNTQASAAIISEDEEFDRIPVIKTPNPQIAFVEVTRLFFAPYRPSPEIHPKALVSPSAKIGKDVAIGAFSFIGDEVEIGDNTIIFPLVSVYPRVKIGEDCIIHSQVSLREDVRLGNRVILHNGAVIGSDGFGYLQAKDGSHIKIPQKGTVVIEDDVEIGTNSAVDRATLGETIIKKGAKIDNLVQIAHNVEIGENSILAGQAGIAGSSKIGKNVILSGQVGVSDHIELGDNVIVAAKGGITKKIPANTTVAGAPQLEIQEWRKAWASVPQLYELIKEVRRLKKQIEELRSK
jgi:UDP-3-O-[3-hydroxymyristoyl] glucosamine N-acyltransferase